MNNIENILINIKPFVLNFSVLVSIIMIFIGIIITIYGFRNKLWENKTDMLKYFLSTTGLGLVISITGTMIAYINEIEIHTELYKNVIPFGLLLSICIFIFLVSKKEKE